MKMKMRWGVHCDLARSLARFWQCDADRTRTLILYRPEMGMLGRILAPRTLEDKNRILGHSSVNVNDGGDGFAY